MIDRAKFFAGVRNGPFPGTLNAPQVEGMNAILDEWDRRKLTDLRSLAYMLATAFHETGARMQPIIETTNARDIAPVSVDTAIARLEHAYAAGKMPWVKHPYWRKDAAGKSWLGRGLPQVTHEDNYRKAEVATGIPFTRDPELMRVLANAVPVMFDGMIRGWFTGHKLADYFIGEKELPKEARHIINGTESAEKVAGYYKAFLSDLRTADVATATAPAPLPVPSIVPENKKELTQVGGATVGTGFLAIAWQHLMGSGALRVALVCAIIGVTYWLLVRPVLKRMGVLDRLYAQAGLYETSWFSKARVAIKGVKTRLFGWAVGIAGVAGGFLQSSDLVDFSAFLPTIYGISPSMYWPIVVAPLLTWAITALRKATSTPMGQTDLAIADVVPVAPPAPVETIPPFPELEHIDDAPSLAPSREERPARHKAAVGARARRVSKAIKKKKR